MTKQIVQISVTVTLVFMVYPHNFHLLSAFYLCYYRVHAVHVTHLFTPPCWQARTAENEYEMNGASVSFKATEFTAHFNSKDIDLYIAKLNRLNIADPYNALGVLLTCVLYERLDFLTCSILICTTTSSTFPPNVTPETL